MTNFLRFALLVSLLCASLCTAQAADEPPFFADDFSGGLDNWWAEGGRTVWVDQGRLHVDADVAKKGAPGQVATVWFKKLLPTGDLRVECKAQVESSEIKANNINFFLCYSDPSGRDLFETRAQRASADYALYHNLSGYIITFLREPAKGANGSADAPNARVRIRRCPGFRLLAEKFVGRCETGRTYDIAITKRGGRLEFAVDGQTLLAADDPQPLEGGRFALRTYATKLWYESIRISQLPAKP